MLLIRVTILPSPAVENILGFITRESFFSTRQHNHENVLTVLVGFLPYFDVSISLEYTGRGALIHIYGSLFRADPPFLVSMRPSHHLKDPPVTFSLHAW